METILLSGLLVLIVFMPYFVTPLSVDSPGPNLETIRFVQSLKVDDAVNMLEAEGGYYIYLGDNFQRVAEFDKDLNFYRWLQDRRINMIVVSDTLMNDSRFKDDPEWGDFLENYVKFGYVQFDIPKTNRKLIIDSGLLREQ